MPDVFEDIIDYPDSDALRTFDSLVGLDETKSRLLKEGAALLDVDSLYAWSEQFHRTRLALLKYVANRPPLFIFEGDVGTGKTALAKSFGDAIARKHKISVQLCSVSLNARGSGAVGEMTTLIGAAFSEVSEMMPKRSKGSNKAAILLIDEGDALAQSREMAQMHHEDRAGVNALIRGIDKISDGNRPILVVLCTNRIKAIDPAIQRRACNIFRFTRPNSEQREKVLDDALTGTGLTQSNVLELARLTGKSGSRSYGFTFSDITQRLIPAIVFEAYPEKPITFELAKRILLSTFPTPVFNEDSQ